MRRRWLIIAVILTAPSGCDNVAWGGVDVSLRAPGEEVEDTLPQSIPEAEEPTGPALPTGPILLAGTRDGASATLTVVGAIAGDSLIPFPSEAEIPGYRDQFVRRFLSPGQALTLFAEGVRVGRLTVTDTDVDLEQCVAKPRVRGIVELVPDAANVDHVLALTGPEATRRPFGDFRVLAHNYNQRVASLNLASGIIQQLGMRWPASVLEARADIQAFHRSDSAEPSIAATFLLGDRLAVGESAPDAYSLFVLATRGPEGYARDYVWYRESATDGKGAPRLFDHLDWDGDGSTEVLLDVFGSEDRWFAAISPRGGSWTRFFEDPCGAPLAG
ncbi:MAG: hypothetical protein P8170_20345 [Gemmatimonadota bacterium]|jgi:hypothetical protein